MTSDAGDGSGAVKVEICHVPQTAAEEYSGRHVTCILLDHGIKGLRKDTIKRSPRIRTSDLLRQQYPAQYTQIGGKHPPTESNATGPQATSPDGGVVENVAMQRKEGVKETWRESSERHAFLQRKDPVDQRSRLRRGTLSRGAPQTKGMTDEASNNTVIPHDTAHTHAIGPQLLRKGGARAVNRLGLTKLNQIRRVS